MLPVSCDHKTRPSHPRNDTVTVTGEVKGQDVNFTIRSKDARAWTTTFTGTMNEAGTTIAGTFRFTNENGRFTASKQS